MPQPRIELVCFDLGGVLVKICDGWAEACARAAVAAPAHIQNQAVKRRMRQITNRYETGQIDNTTFDVQTSEITGLTPHQVQAACRASLKEPYPGIDALLDALAPTGLRTACLSNTNARHWSMMLGKQSSESSLPLYRLTYRLASHLIGAAKPETMIFKHFEKVTGAAPETILFFDDTKENCLAARARGWSAQRIDPRGDTAHQMYDHLVGYQVLRPAPWSKTTLS